MAHHELIDHGRFRITGGARTASSLRRNASLCSRLTRREGIRSFPPPAAISAPLTTPIARTWVVSEQPSVCSLRLMTIAQMARSFATATLSMSTTSTRLHGHATSCQPTRSPDAWPKLSSSWHLCFFGYHLSTSVSSARTPTSALLRC